MSEMIYMFQKKKGEKEFSCPQLFNSFRKVTRNYPYWGI